jgi:hypothetical protein
MMKTFIYNRRYKNKKAFRRIGRLPDLKSADILMDHTPARRYQPKVSMNDL